jgi:hypothetical protein
VLCHFAAPSLQEIAHQAAGLGSVLGQLKRHLHVALRAQVVHLIRPGLSAQVGHSLARFNPLYVILSCCDSVQAKHMRRS